MPCSRQRSVLLWSFVLWAGVLAWLWRESWAYGAMAFSNDGPLGLMAAYSEGRWDNLFYGSWSPTVWLGSPALPLQPSFSNLLYLTCGPVLFGKLVAPLSLLLLALSAGVYCRSRGFASAVGVVTGLAAALNTNFLSHAAWGLGSRAAAAAFALLALAALPTPGSRRRWARYTVAGGLVGLCVIEGADVGAIFSLYLAAYLILFPCVLSGTHPIRSILATALPLAWVAAVAAGVACHALVPLIRTQIQEVAVLSEKSSSRAERWAFATSWSFPKREVVRILIPGIQGFRADTPDGGAYWGNVGIDGTPATRSNGGGESTGIVVLLIAGWAAATAWLRPSLHPFRSDERAQIRFWSVAGLVSLLFAFGRFAPFYRLVFEIPALSAIRIPMKFLHPMHLAVMILFAFGLEGLRRRAVLLREAARLGTNETRKSRKAPAPGLGRPGLIALGIGILLILFAAAGYAHRTHALAREIAAAGFPTNEARTMAHFSVTEVWRSALVAILALLGLAGWISGRFQFGHPILPFVAAGALLVLDLGMAATPFITHYDYLRRYDSNAVLNLLARDPWLGRVTARIFPDRRATLSGPGPSAWPLLQNQWMEHQFPFNRVQTLDIWQMPRMPEWDAQLLAALHPDGASDAWRIGRLWQLTNVRYVVGASGILPELNSALDPVARSFRPVLSFDLALRGNPAASGGLSPDDLTVVEQSHGALSVFEYGNSLPRVRLYSDWEAIPETPAILGKLRDPGFDPLQRVLLDRDPVPGADGAPIKDVPVSPGETAHLVEWAPKRIQIHTASSVPGILLLNERWDPDWRAWVDGRTTPVLRANLLMRAVSVPAGEHRVEFRYQPSQGTLWVTLACLAVVAMAAGTVLGWVPTRFPGGESLGVERSRRRPTSWTGSSDPSAT